MTVRFVSSAGMRFRVLREEEGGVWLISYDEPAAPILDCSGGLERIETPEAFMDNVKRREKGLTKAEQERLDLIAPLLDNEDCMTQKQLRKSMADNIAQRMNTTRQRVLRIYYRYLATGILVAAKKREVSRNLIYERGIQTFYYSSKKLSLYAAYEMMIAQEYTDQDGKLRPDAPTWSSFQHYFYRHHAHLQPEKTIARNGLSHYLRNHRPLTGTMAKWRTAAGAYQMDATQADIYLVSRLNRTQVVDRPYIYLAVDTATQLIAGLYVGYEAGETAVMECLAQASEDKVTYCQKHGIEIDPQQWPSSGLPNEVITDKGRDFCGKRMQELCMRYGVEMQSLPPFRPEAKGLVEKSFDLLQQRYKPLLRGHGVIEEDAQERWATDYRNQACLNLDDFRAVLIHCVLDLNAGRLLASGKTPSQEWREKEKTLLQVDPMEVYRMALPRQRLKLVRRGIHINALWYAPAACEGLLTGQTYTVAYDPSDAAKVFIVTERGWIECLRVDQNAGRGVSIQEERCLMKRLREEKRNGRKYELESGVATIGHIQKILDQAKRGE